MKRQRIIESDTDDDIDLESLPTRKHSGRTASASKSQSNSEVHSKGDQSRTEENNSFENDDSSDDYVPETNSNNGTIRRKGTIQSNQTKKSKKNSGRISPINLENDAAEEMITDFNTQFQTTMESQNLNSSQKQANNNSIHEVNSTQDHADFIRQIISVESQLDAKCDRNECSKKYEVITDKLNEILVRFSAIERTILSNSHSQSTEDAKETKTQLFLESNRLPVENKKDLEEFEKKLKDSVFQTSAVSPYIIDYNKTKSIKLFSFN